jgi:hypothetical protein
VRRAGLEARRRFISGRCSRSPWELWSVVDNNTIPNPAELELAARTFARDPAA